MDDPGYAKHWNNSSLTGSNQPRRFSDLHMHLFGCLTWDEVHHFGRDRWQAKIPLLQWFHHEYEKAYGRPSRVEHYWTHPMGQQWLKEDVGTYVGFSQFQAGFNLIIAIFKMHPEEHYLDVFHHVLTKHQTLLTYGEYRVMFPYSFRTPETFSYLCAFANTCKAMQSDNFTPRLAVSLSREHSLRAHQYEVLRMWQRDFPQYTDTIVAIDFCGTEPVGFPEDMRAFFAQVKADNHRDPATALKLLYHVGEQFDGNTLEAACISVWDAHRAGADRLGHALALGVDPSAHVTDTQQAREIYHLQEKLLAQLAETEAVIEACPTSNLQTLGLTDLRDLPLKRFIQHGINVVIATDNPGLLSTNIAVEYEKAGTALA